MENLQKIRLTPIEKALVTQPNIYSLAQSTKDAVRATATGKITPINFLTIEIVPIDQSLTLRKNIFENLTIFDCIRVI